MPFVTLHGLQTRYETVGDGPPLLMFSPGGFDASLENWTSFGRYRDLGFIDTLSRSFTCVVYDRRESGQSGGRVERLSWRCYVDQALALLDHLDLESAHVMGGCVGCSIATALATTAPGRVRSLVLFSPAGGARYRMAQHRRFAQHRSFVAEHGLPGVLRLAHSSTSGFSKDPRLGPWIAPIRADPEFAEAYAALEVARYDQIASGSARLLFDRDTVPGAEAEDLMGLTGPALIVPGDDASHAPSAARYLQECLPNNEYWDVPVIEQTRASAAARVLAFLERTG